MDIDKLERMADDIITHKIYVLQVCHKVFQYLSEHDQLKLGIDLLKRAANHDNSKFNNDEFKNMAQILNSDECFKNAEYKLSPEEKKAIETHWKHNKHHPEYFENLEDMTELDMLEMVCDWYARSLQYGTDFIEFVRTRQKVRFKFSEKQFDKICTYCILVEGIYYDYKS